MAKASLIKSARYPYLQVRFQVRAHVQQVWAYLDTGFDGYLAIPGDLSGQLGVGEWLDVWELANGQTVEAPAYLGAIEILSLAISIPARITCLGNEYILGRAILDRFRVTFDHGHRVQLEA